ncbi:expressed unknown protein [Seminavis robusta]|uniref:gamma-glutamylcyclotransferase n=1 Tax=Seminavis robusta TaxID=568900 RepID=A0A9N8HQM3_9STRA|nr:expressed unknown protein [Seminavis robusta]|eukprot:Sro1303_g261040.1 n/a (376) ;mRNA; r:23515-24642
MSAPTSTTTRLSSKFLVSALLLLTFLVDTVHSAQASKTKPALIVGIKPLFKREDSKALESTTATTTATPQPPTRPELVTQSLEKNADLYYFGLGSNMLRQKLENRAIDGSKINVKSFQPAVVYNYRLAFNMKGFPPLEPGMGSLEPTTSCMDAEQQLQQLNQPSTKQQDNAHSSISKPLCAYQENECHGALVRLSAEDYEKVMRSEGVGHGRSDQGYEEVVVDAVPYKGRVVQAVALRARSHVRLSQDPAPSQRYMDILKQGAQELGLAPAYVDFLNQHPVQQSSAWTRRIAVCNLALYSSQLVSFQSKLRKLQVWLLWRVYVPPTANVLQRILSELAIGMILLPGAIPGSLCFLHMKRTNKMNGMMKALADNHW